MAPFVGFAMEKYLVNAIVNFWRLASILAKIMVVKPAIVQEFSSVLS